MSKINPVTCLFSLVWKRNIFRASIFSTLSNTGSMYRTMQLRFVQFLSGNIVRHSKNTVTRKRVHWGPYSIPDQRWPRNQSTWREIWPRAGSVWPHYLSIWLISGSSLTRNGVWPQWTLFRVTADRGVFRVDNAFNFSLFPALSYHVPSSSPPPPLHLPPPHFSFLCFSSSSSFSSASFSFASSF